jgi:4-amino-4-deoxy-L-arabinose transferase-like glycosyltransferase
MNKLNLIAKRVYWLGPLVIIILIALALRMWGIQFGLPYMYHYDEHFYINTALKLGAGILNNAPYAATGLSNILFGEYAVYYILGRALGWFTSAGDFEAVFRTDPTVFYLIGRLTTAMLGVATVPILYFLGKTGSNRTTGLVAAGLAAVSFLHVRDSHYAVPDIAMATFVVLAVTLSAIGLRTHKRRYIYMAALVGGLAMATKWTGLPVALAIGWAALWVDADKGVIRRLGATLIISGLLFGLGFAIGSPQILINPAPYINEALGQASAGQAGGFEIWQVDTLPGWLFYGKTLLLGLGPVLFALGIAGAIGRLARVKGDAKVSILLLLFPLVYFLLMGSTRHYFARYALPLVPFLALFAAEAAMGIVALLKVRNPRLQWSIAALLLVLAAVPPLAQSIRHDLLLSRLDTRTLAKQWIEANIPEGSKIAVDWPVHTPPLSTSEKAVPYSEKLFDVFDVGGAGLSQHSNDWYRQQGFDYLIASSYIYEIPLIHPDQNTQRRVFYATLEQELELVQVFLPYEGQENLPFVFDEIYGPLVGLWQRERPGPTLKIYKVATDKNETVATPPLNHPEK